MSNETVNYRERIKRRLPAGYDRLFGRNEHDAEHTIGAEARPSTIRRVLTDAAARSATPGTLEPTGQRFEFVAMTGNVAAAVVDATG